MDRRRGFEYSLQGDYPWLANPARWSNRRPHYYRMALVSSVLELQHLHHLSRYGLAQTSRKLGRAFRTGDDRLAARMGCMEGQWPGLLSKSTGALSYIEGVLANLHSFTHRNDRVLGHSFT